jgi:ribosomal protein S18 acetylase RimI-like enzyme
MKPDRLDSLKVGTARPEEREQAFRLIFQHSAASERTLQISNGLELVRQGEMDPDGLLVARDHRGLVGAMVCLPVPGASGLVWPPQARDLPDKLAIEDHLVHGASAWLRQRGAKLAQSLLIADDRPLAESLVRNGFNYITSLWYLRHELAGPPVYSTNIDHLSYETYGNADLTLFHQTLMRTYVDTEDCPEVNGIRTIDEIIAGHKAQGRHDPDRWWLAFAGHQPVGVLLVVDMAAGQGWDISYVGVVPEARRQGHGRELTCKAIRAALAANIQQLTLAVDTRNQAARCLYEGLGFHPYDQREVFLAVWI